MPRLLIEPIDIPGHQPMGREGYDRMRRKIAHGEAVGVATAVMVRSYSRSSGSTVLDTESGTPGSSSAAIAAMVDGARLVNCARGELVDLDATTGHRSLQRRGRRARLGAPRTAPTPVRRPALATRRRPCPSSPTRRRVRRTAS